MIRAVSPCFSASIRSWSFFSVLLARGFQVGQALRDLDQFGRQFLIAPIVVDLALVELGLLRIAQMFAAGFAPLLEGVGQVGAAPADGAVGPLVGEHLLVDRSHAHGTQRPDLVQNLRASRGELASVFHGHLRSV